MKRLEFNEKTRKHLNQKSSEVIGYLRKIAAKGASVCSDPFNGLCVNLSNFMGVTGFGDRVLQHYIDEWPHFSGDYSYPVPHPDYISPDLAYQHTLNMYGVTDYGRLRRNLAGFIANCIERDFKVPR